MREDAMRACNRDHCEHRASGFSLIELAIVITLIGLVSAPLLHRYQVYQTQEKIDNTTISMTAVNNALGEFFIENGRYPCPSDRAVAFGAANHGEERCATVVALGNNTCTTNNGLCKATVTGPGASVHIGGVPYKTLGIPYSETLDGYRNSLSYAVSSAYDDATRANAPNRPGAISVDRVEFPVTGVPATTTDTGIYYLLRSAGGNGNGAFGVNGGAPKPCGTGQDQENCDVDGLFMDMDLSEGATDFDDRIMAVAWSPASIWAYADTPGAIYNTNTGAVGIGTTTPGRDGAGVDPNIRLDVDGDVRAQQFRSTQYCDASGDNCFETRTIAGTGIQCPNGQYLIGVRNNQPVCQPMRVNVPANVCPSGQFVTSISATGVIQCAAP